MLPQEPKFSRRRLLAAGLGLGIGGALLPRLPALPQVRPAESAEREHHLVWVWQFTDDGPPDVIGRDLLDASLGIVLKTHDGTRWMSQFDDSPYSVSGPEQVGVLATYYESAGIPFHAWAVVEGLDPTLEAEMAASVLAAGARSLYLDLGAAYDAWKGAPDAAGDFGRVLRRLQPEGRVVLMLDPRPWLREKVPWRDFAAFSDGLAIEDYWRIFASAENRATFAESGFAVPAGGPSPEFLIELSETLFGSAGKPMTYIGEGSAEADEFSRFLATAAPERGVGVWRFGTMSPEVLLLLRERQPIEATPTPPTQRRTHIVQAGETLSEIAELYDVIVEALIDANDIESADHVEAWAKLIIP
jgi:hypothetical protein